MLPRSYEDGCAVEGCIDGLLSCGMRAWQPSAMLIYD